MNEKSLDEILECLAWIGLNKSMMPSGLTGWVSQLGLHVQMKDAGKRVLAGGMWRPYIDAEVSSDDNWNVRKFDKATWDKRFAPILEPTLEISEFLFRCADGRGLHGESERAYWNTINHYRSTGEWKGLTISQEMREAANSRQESEKLRNWALAHESAAALIRELEMQIADDPAGRIKQGRTQSQLFELYQELVHLGVAATVSTAWVNNKLDFVLQDLYGRFRGLSLWLGKYQGYEEATKRLIDAPWANPSPWEEPDQRFRLGMFYAAALSNDVRGRGGALWPSSVQSDLTTKSLGYETRQVREWATMNLTRAREHYWGVVVTYIREIMEGHDEELSARGYSWYQHTRGVMAESDEELLAREYLRDEHFRAVMEEFEPGFTELTEIVEQIDGALRAVNTMSAFDFDEIDNCYARRHARLEDDDTES